MGGMCISQFAWRCYYRRRARSEQRIIPKPFAINAFRRATVLTMDNPDAGQRAARRIASKTEPEEYNITPVSSTYKNKEDTHRELV
jgi:hypothetical protein